MSKYDEQMLVEKSWNEFRETGLVVFINTILHVFGWAITFLVDNDNNVIQTYPSRTRFRGFDKKTVDESYIKISRYMSKNAEQLHNECEE